MMNANSVVQPNAQTMEQRGDYERLKLTPDEYLKLFNTGHSGGLASVAQAPVAELSPKYDKDLPPCTENYG